MKTSLLCAKLFETDPRQIELFASNAHRALRTAMSVTELAKRIASYTNALDQKLREDPEARREAKVLLGRIPVDFEVGCGCATCTARRSEWQHAKEGEA